MNIGQAFVSEYAVWRSDAGRGSLLASLAEAAFLTGLEKNRWFLLRFGSWSFTCLVVTPEFSSKNYSYVLSLFIKSLRYHGVCSTLLASTYWSVLWVSWPLVDSLQWYCSDGKLCTALCKRQRSDVSVDGYTIFPFPEFLLINITVIICESNNQVESRCYCLQLLATVWNSQLLDADIFPWIEWSFDPSSESRFQLL